MKFDQDVPPELEDISKTIKQDWSIDGKYRPTLIAASTHETEEEEVLSAFKQILKSFPNALLILVPRHLERFDKVNKLINTFGLSLASRSKKDEVKRSTQVLLGDTIGELNFLYSLSDVAFVGGSLIDHGGQNLLEPAAQGIALLSGPSLRNFSDISEQLKQNEGLKIVNDSRELSDRFLEYITDDKARESAGNNALEVFMQNRGALGNISYHLDLLLKERI